MIHIMGCIVNFVIEVYNMIKLILYNLNILRSVILLKISSHSNIEHDFMTIFKN